jgi:hypothetical protein
MEQTMAHFAKLDENNVVVEILVVSNDDIQNLPFPESEAVGVAYLNSFLPEANWKQTSYNNNFRFRYAGIGYTYYTNCGEHGGFAHPKPADNWVWAEETCEWIPPIPYPTDGINYYWDFERNQWAPTIQPAPQTVVIG